MTKQLDDKDVSLDEYKKKLITLTNTYEKEIQELKKELKIAIKKIKIWY